MGFDYPSKFPVLRPRTFFGLRQSRTGHEALERENQGQLKVPRAIRGSRRRIEL